MVERAINQQIKQSLQKIRVFPKEDSRVRRFASLIIRIENDWIAINCTYISWKMQYYDYIAFLFLDRCLHNRNEHDT